MIFGKHKKLKYFIKNIIIVFGIVLIWRGIWYLLDYVDQVIFHGSHAETVVFGIIIGFFMIYLPEKDLKTIERL